VLRGNGLRVDLLLGRSKSRLRLCARLVGEAGFREFMAQGSADEINCKVILHYSTNWRKKAILRSSWLQVQEGTWIERAHTGGGPGGRL